MECATIHMKKLFKPNKVEDMRKPNEQNRPFGHGQTVSDPGPRHPEPQHHPMRRLSDFRRDDPAQRFQLLDLVGEGSFGKVYRAKDRFTTVATQIVAIKIIDVDDAEDEIEDIQQEIMVLSRCNCSCVTQYYASYLKGTKLWITMEYMGGGSVLELMKHMKNGGAKFDENQIATILRDVLTGLVYLHSENVIHRDIKAANILLSEQGEVKLADFGVATQLTYTMRHHQTFVGTPYWMAPEVIEQNNYNCQADIWSLGITAIELIDGQPPHSDLDPIRVLMLIPNHPPPRLDSKHSKAFQQFVAACMQRRPEDRPSAEQLLQMPFVKKVKTNKTKTFKDLIRRYGKNIIGDGTLVQTENFPSKNAENENVDVNGENETETFEIAIWDFPPPSMVRSNLLPFLDLVRRQRLDRRMQCPALEQLRSVILQSDENDPDLCSNFIAELLKTLVFLEDGKGDKLRLVSEDQLENSFKKLGL